MNKFQNGEIKVFKWFIGQIMRETKGMADPTQVNIALCNALGCKPEDIIDAETKASSPSGKKRKGDGKKKKK